MAKAMGMDIYDGKIHRICMIGKFTKYGLSLIHYYRGMSDENDEYIVCTSLRKLFTVKTNNQGEIVEITNNDKTLDVLHDKTNKLHQEAYGLLVFARAKCKKIEERCANKPR